MVERDFLNKALKSANHVTKSNVLNVIQIKFLLKKTGKVSRMQIESRVCYAYKQKKEIIYKIYRKRTNHHYHQKTKAH